MRTRKPIKKRPELHSKITSITLKPSVHKNLQKIAYVTESSISATFCKWAESYISEHQAEIEEYDKMFPDEE